MILMREKGVHYHSVNPPTEERTLEYKLELPNVPLTFCVISSRLFFSSGLFPYLYFYNSMIKYIIILSLPQGDFFFLQIGTHSLVTHSPSILHFSFIPFSTIQIMHLLGWLCLSFFKPLEVRIISTVGTLPRIVFDSLYAQ